MGGWGVKNRRTSFMDDPFFKLLLLNLIGKTSNHFILSIDKSINWKKKCLKVKNIPISYFQKLSILPSKNTKTTKYLQLLSCIKCYDLNKKCVWRYYFLLFTIIFALLWYDYIHMYNPDLQINWFQICNMRLHSLPM